MPRLGNLSFGIWCAFYYQFTVAIICTSEKGWFVRHRVVWIIQSFSNPHSPRSSDPLPQFYLQNCTISHMCPKLRHGWLIISYRAILVFFKLLQAQTRRRTPQNIHRKCGYDITSRVDWLKIVVLHSTKSVTWAKNCVWIPRLFLPSCGMFKTLLPDYLVEFGKYAHISATSKTLHLLPVKQPIEL